MTISHQQQVFHARLFDTDTSLGSNPDIHDTMSPYEPLPISTTSKQASSESESDTSSSFPNHIQSLLNKYDVTTNGFLPDGPPLEVLPDEYYAPWENLIRRLSESLDAGTFQEEVDRLPILETDGRLKTEEEWRRAYVVLCFFAHGYIWGGSMPSEVSSRSCLAGFGPWGDGGPEDEDVLTRCVGAASTNLRSLTIRLLPP